MTTVKLSFHGAMIIPFLVRQWNESKDAEAKKYIRSLLQSGRNEQIEIGVAKIIEMFDLGTKNGDFVNNFYVLDFFIIGQLEQDKDSELVRSARMKNNIAFYFDQMFRAGHFEQLPMPEFRCELPETTTAAKAGPIEVDMEAMLHQPLMCSSEKLMQGAAEMAAEHAMPRPAEEIRFGPPRRPAVLEPPAQQDP